MNVTLLVGQNIRNSRKRKGVKLEILADKLQIDKSTLSKMETGRIGITIERVGKIAEALELNFNDLIAVPLSANDENASKAEEDFVEVN